MNEDHCVINLCVQPQGIGTWTRIEMNTGQYQVLPVCEDHWQALRAVKPKVETLIHQANDAVVTSRAASLCSCDHTRNQHASPGALGTHCARCDCTMFANDLLQT